MPTAAERASHLRQTLRALLADYQQRLDDLLPLRQLLKGSVYELKTRCGLAENYRRFRQNRAALVKLHSQILVAIDRLERALLLPPPKPAAQRKS